MLWLDIITYSGEYYQQHYGVAKALVHGRRRWAIRITDVHGRVHEHDRLSSTSRTGAAKEEGTAGGRGGSRWIRRRIPVRWG